MALKHIAVGGGVVDQDYESNVIVILFNHSDEPYEIYKGDRIGQFTSCRKTNKLNTLS